MNQRTKFEKKVVKPAIREVRKYHKKYGELPDESVLKDLKIQIINPFIRISTITFGLFLLVAGFFSILDQSIFLGIVFLVVGLILCVIGFRGKKKKIEGVLEKSGNFDDIALIIEAVLHIDW